MASPFSAFRRVRRPISAAMLIFAWGLAALMALTCFFRAFGVDTATTAVAITSAAPWILAPSPILAILAFWQRRRVLALIAVTVMAAGLCWEVPVMWPFSRAAPPAAGGHLKLLDANIAQDNFRPAEIASEIRADHPEVISMEELTPQALGWLEKDGVLSGYRWNVVSARYGAGGMGMWSSIPIRSQTIWDGGAGQAEIDAILEPPGGEEVDLNVVHVYAPVGLGQPALWISQLSRIRSHIASEPHPLIVAGDLNATADDKPFQQLLGLGLADAAVEAGKGWEMTWPRDQAWVIPYLRIDHILISSDLTITGYKLGVGAGSDHHPLIVDLAPRRP